MTEPAAGLRARIRGRAGTLVIDVDIDTGGGTLVLIGPNGAGKTSVLSLLLGVLPVEGGRIQVGDAVLFDSDGRVNVPLEHRRMGYVPQDYALFPHLTVGQNIDFALRSAPAPLHRAGRAARVVESLAELGLADSATRAPRTLSAGEKQRVALARALSVGPRALLLDEPLAALDVHSRRQVRTFLAGYLRALALPTIVVTHDAEDARLLGDRLAIIEAGRIVQAGTWNEVAARPATPFVAEFVAAAGPAGVAAPSPEPVPN